MAPVISGHMDADAGVSRAALFHQLLGRYRRRGPRANPGRRFAVWALSKDSAMTNGEIGRLLGMLDQPTCTGLRIAWA